MMLVLALTRLGKPVDAMIPAPTPMEGPEARRVRAAQALGTAVAWHHVGRYEDARRSLRVALEEDATFTAPRIRASFCSPLLDQDWFRAVVTYSDHMTGGCDCSA